MRAGTGLVVVLRCRICRSPARRPVPATSSSPSALRRAAATAQMPARRLSAVESSTLLQALEAVPDPRQRRGRRHPLHSMLYLALGGVGAGADSCAAIADWAAVTDHNVAVGRRSPHASTFRRLLGRVEVTALEAALTGWVLGRRDTAARQAAAAGGPVAERRMVLAADGKTLRGAHQPDGSQTKLLCLYDHAHQLVLAQTPVLDGDEIAAFTTALAALPDLSGVVITADALHCQRAHAVAAWARRALSVHGQGEPADAAPGGGRAAVGPGARVPAPAGRPRPHRVPLDQGPRPGQPPDPGAVSACAAGDQGRSSASLSAHRPAVGGDGVRGHLAGLPARRPRVAGGLDPRSLGRREPRPSRPGCDPE